MSDLHLYTAVEVAEVLRMNPQVIQRKLQAGEIPGYRIGREWRVERGQLLEWLEKHSNRRVDETDPWFEAEGRLVSLPARKADRRRVLERVARSLERRRTYSESELNEVLSPIHHDVSALRRELVGEKLLVRNRTGIYKVTTGHEPPLRRG